jgi:hypothetical protein
MRTFLYYTDTGVWGPFRNGRYMVDGKPGELPDNVVEIEYVEGNYPNYDFDTQTVERSEGMDLNEKKYFVTYSVRNLTSEEIENRKPKYGECTPRQFRLGLLDFGIDPDSITNMIQQIPDEEERKRVMITWEYAVMIEKNNPLILQFAQILGFSTSDVDEIFRLANQYE